MSSADIVAASAPTIVASNTPIVDILAVDRELGSKSSKTKTSKSTSSKKKKKKQKKKNSVFNKSGDSSSQSKKKKKSSPSSKSKKKKSSSKVSTLNRISYISCSHIPLFVHLGNSLHTITCIYTHKSNTH